MTDDLLPGLDLIRLGRHLAANLVPAPTGTLRAELITGGRSNLTYLLSDERSEWVLRRPPLGHVLATAHDVAREHRVMSALRETPVPVPRTHLLCCDVEVIGAPFYLMERVPGTPYRSAAQLDTLGTSRVRSIMLAVVDTLAELHHVDPASVGLSDLGRPDGYLERQVRRWKRQLDATRAEPIPGIDELHDALAASVPTGSGVAILHGDYRLDNVLVDELDRIRAVLDWELATLGDPLADLALFVARNGDMISGGGLMFDASSAAGFPASAELVERYAVGSGRDVGSLDWYVALAHFKRATILDGIRDRARSNPATSGDLGDVASVVELTVEAGLLSLARR
jgi:aminoglycoside phosphotransferase (APT) family kinase protein